MDAHEDQEQGPSSSCNWVIPRKSISLPSFGADNSRFCFKIDNEERDETFIRINSDFLKNEAHILIRSPSPQIVITPPAIDRPFRYAPYMRSTPHPKSKTQNKRQIHASSDPKFNASNSRLSSRLYKRRNAVSTFDLNFLHSASQSMLMVPEEQRPAKFTFELKRPKKRVTFTNSEPFAEDDVFCRLSEITSSCIQLSNQMNGGSNKHTNDTHNLVENFQDSCQISVTVVPSVTTEALCTRFPAMSITEETTISTAPVTSTSTSFACQNPFNISCLNL